jgi:signal transduction histidine kinase
MTLAFAPVDFPGLQWQVIIEQPWEDVIGPVLRYSQFVPFVVVLAVIISLLALYYGVSAIVRPLQSLGRRAEQIAWGDLRSTDSPVGGVKEIEELRLTLDDMAHRIRGYQRSMHDYIGAITKGQEEERRRLARELHDDTAQTLIALRQQIELAQKLHHTDPSGEEERLDEVRAMLAKALEDVRRFSHNLRPIYLEDLGFVPALEMKAQEIEQLHCIKVHVDVQGERTRLHDDLELTAYRVAQEALNNVVQHAQATVAWVSVHFLEEHLILSVQDDGRGFVAPSSPRDLAALGHFGLMGLHERTILHGGQLNIEAEPGTGTTITVLLPYYRPIHRDEQD